MPDLSGLAQYGALGLIAAALLYINVAHQKQMAERLTNLENNMMQIIENNTKAIANSTSVMSRMVDEWENRPCWLNKPEVQKILREAGFLTRNNGDVRS